MEGRIVIAQRLSIHQRKVQKRGRTAAKAYVGMTIDHMHSKGHIRQKKKQNIYLGLGEV